MAAGHVFAGDGSAVEEYHSSCRVTREVFHGIHPDRGGDGTRVVCCGVGHHRARKRHHIECGTICETENPRCSQAGGFSISAVATPPWAGGDESTGPRTDCRLACPLALAKP